ncbi:hypothetical protein RM543_07250 [Roseicyclus sp. F158]|uniref:Colanic acid biosynthesis acetyltransferase n=1 Tax=Tropicimonas omnivorans TaxID=3075590 RepID=A0ABU3DFK1_9RHOB|nr:hypothetical protein [Roseicyclus sp. F158]MDT0682474.1 hypothetical protein [Roseicyclus sp. F158]
MRAGPDPLQACEGRNIFTGGASFTLANRLERIMFAAVWLLLARWTPPPLHTWRAGLLRVFGARIGAGARIYGSAAIWLPRNLDIAEEAVIGPRVRLYAMGRIAVGRRAVISQGAHLCGGTHDTSDPSFKLVTRPVEVGERAWICAEAFVGPGVRVGEGAVLGARGVAMRSLAPWMIHAGNPAREVRARDMARPPR